MNETIDNRSLSFNPYDPTADSNETSYRKAFADGLEKVLDEGADSLEALASGLNERSVAGPSGQSWTAEFLEQELRRLAW